MTIIGMLFIVLYTVIGFITGVVWLRHNDQEIDRDFAFMAVLVWPIFAFVYGVIFAIHCINDLVELLSEMFEKD